MSFTWLDALQRLRAIAQTGLTYGTGPYDLERYREIAQIAEQGLAELLGASPAAITAQFVLDRGYPTPKVDVRTAVFHEGKILLVREAADGFWTMPGGWADETDSPCHAAEREVAEESGYRMKVTRLISVRDRRWHGYQPRLLGGCYKLFFLADLIDGVAKPSLETTEVAFFSVDQLPPLSVARTVPEDIAQALAAHEDRAVPVIVD
jgi:ADP-ribose pyrophosphatase YjhB (NUDIX family)